MKELKKDFTKELQAQAEIIQNESHEMINGIRNEKPDLTYQDAMNVFLFAKLAQLQMQIDMKEDKNYRKTIYR